ncbi:MAG TPA: permease prefix domain 1-containing protein [Pseudolysinimonas sp.]|nr:permease prefix domain 1-containing protein [Pseudolysinimonas sp.]
MTATLTDRYIWAVQRSLPEAQRDDIDRELRGTIADTIDAKLESGLGSAEAERATIAELGDPYRLAAGYADRPLVLIGPDLFPSYIRLLKLLYAIVLPCAAGGVTLALLLSRPESVGAVMGPLWATILGVTVHLGFWVTLLFALIERGPKKDRASIGEWSPENLPDVPQRGDVKLSDAIGSVVFLVTMFGLVLWQQFWPVVTADDGTPLPLLNEGLWSLWLPVLFGIALVEIAFAVLVWRFGRWTVPLAVVNAVLAIAAAAVLVWLFVTDQVVNPAWAQQLGLSGLVAPGGVLAVIGAFAATGIALWDIIDGVIKTVRARRP